MDRDDQLRFDEFLKNEPTVSKSYHFVDFVDSKDDFAQMYSRYLDHIKQENDLVNYRLNWFFIILILLASSVGYVLYGSHLDKRLFVEAGAWIGMLASAAAYLSVFAAFLAMGRLSHLFKKFSKTFVMRSGFKINDEALDRMEEGRKGRFTNFEIVELPPLMGGGSKLALYIGHIFALFAPLASFLFWLYILLNSNDPLNILKKWRSESLMYPIAFVAGIALTIYLLHSTRIFKFKFFSGEDYLFEPVAKAGKDK